MIWKEKVKILEQHDDFDVAVFFLEQVIKENPDDVDAYIFMLFRLMDTIVEHACHFSNVSRTPVSDIKSKYYDTKEDYYESLAKRYFKEGYAKFSDNAEFLFYVGITAAMSEWYFGIETQDYERMLDKALLLDPDNFLYKSLYYKGLDMKRESNKEEVVKYAQEVLYHESRIKNIVADKGAAGECCLELTINWSKEILGIPTSR